MEFFCCIFSRCFRVCFHGWRNLLTHAGAAFTVRIQCPSLITGAFDQVLVLFTHLGAPLVGGTVVHDFTGFIVFLELVSFWAGADNSSSRNNRTVVTTASVVERTLICQGADGLSHMVFLTPQYSLIGFSNSNWSQGFCTHYKTISHSYLAISTATNDLMPEFISK